MVEIANDARARAAKLRERRDADVGRIERRRYLVQNAPVVAGTRVGTAAVYRLHRAGYDASSIIREFQRLKPDDVTAAIKYEEKRQKRSA